MDGRRFDAWVRARTAGTASRRGVIRATTGGLLAGWLALLGREETAAARCRAVGRRCDRDKDCCSFFCNKTGRRNKCGCARRFTRCTRDADCCRNAGTVCGDNGFGVLECCLPPGSDCIGGGGCCGNAPCQGGKCT